MRISATITVADLGIIGRMELPTAEDVVKLGAGAVAAVATFLTIGRKWLKGWVTDGAAIETVNLLREEVRRLAQVNTKLAEEVNRLHVQNMRLQTEIEQLHQRLERTR